MCFRDVLYLEGRSCALPSSSSLFDLPCLSFMCKFDLPFSTCHFRCPKRFKFCPFIEFKTKKSFKAVFVTSFSVSITFIKTNIAISLNILKYTHRTTPCHSRHSPAAKYFTFVNLVSQLPTGVKTLRLFICNYAASVYLSWSSIARL